ncbi:MAG: hypothetical protein Rubg2KO_31730 [Rubricoccaceae bacterium]
MTVSFLRQLADAASRFALVLLALALTPIATAQVDSDGDGVANDLELAGFRFDLGTGEAVACNPATDSPCFVTDPLAWSSDGDPYSDFQEASGVNMDASVEAPYNSPLVAAYPIIEVALDAYTFTSNATITDARGAALSQGSSFSRNVGETVGASVTVGAEYNAITGPSVSGEATASYSRTEAYGTEITSGTEINWETATSTELNNAGTLSLSLFARNSGGATALNVRPTFNVYIGRALVATIYPDQSLALSLAPGESSAPVEPSFNTGQTGVQLTFDQLVALERGAAVSIEVTDIEADIQRWQANDGWQCSADDTCLWDSFHGQIKSRTLRLLVDFGYSGDPDADIPAQFRGNPFDYRIYTGSPSTSPNLTLRDVLGLAGFSVTGSGNGAAIEGRSYLNSWILFEQPRTSGARPLQDAWRDAGQPQDLLDVVMPRDATLGMTSPDPLNPGVAIREAAVTSDALHIRAAVAARGGVPVVSAVATVMQNGITRTVDLQPVFGRAYWSTEGSDLPDTPISVAASYVEFTDLAGDVQRSPLTLPIQQAASCAGVPEAELRSAPGPGGRAVLFPTGDLDDPVEAYCVPGSNETRYWVPQPTPETQSTRSFMDAPVLLDDGTIIAGGASVSRSQDQGRSWTEVASLSSNGFIFDIAYRAGTQTLIAVQSSLGPTLRSTDGGRTWQESSQDLDLRAVTHAEGAVWYATEYGAQDPDRVFRSDDDGLTFTPLSLPENGRALTDVEFRDASTGIVVDQGNGSSGSGSIWRTTDGGATWTKVLRAHNTIHVTYAGDDTWFVTGGRRDSPERVLRSTDDGLTWANIPLPVPDISDGPGKAAFLTPQLGYVPVPRVGILKTEDGGDTWALEPAASSDLNVRSVLIFDENRAIAMGREDSTFDPLILLTTSGGTGSVIVSNEDPAEPVASPTAVTLEPNAPNPFRDRTTVVYTLDAPGDVELAIYDLLGREVARLVDAPQAAGEHRVAFEARGMAPGVYVARLTMGGEVATRRMTLVR